MAGLSDFLTGFIDPTENLPFAIVHRGGGIPIVFLFPLAPSSVDEVSRSRMQLHQTFDGTFLDDFSGPNSMVPRVTIRGTFGRKAKPGGLGIPMPGSLHLRALEATIETFNALKRETKATARAVQEWIDPSRLHFWRIAIEGVHFKRSDQSPLLHFYEISFIRLDDYLSPTGPHLPPSTTTNGTSILSDFSGGLL